MQLATVSRGQPWVCSVWFGFDDDFNIYFFSATNRRHSEEIAKDNRVAGAIVMPHSPSDPDVQAIQFEGRAGKLVEEADVAKAHSVYEGRIFNRQTIDKLMANPQKPHAFYKITPTKFVLFDTKNFPDNSRQELEMKK